MFLRDIGHVVKALDLLHEAKQELLMIGNEQCCSFYSEIEKIECQLTNTLQKESGKEWSAD